MGASKFAQPAQPAQSSPDPGLPAIPPHPSRRSAQFPRVRGLILGSLLTVLLPGMLSQTALANLARYVVYINSANPSDLSRARQVDPTAQFEQWNGKTAIRAGSFNQSGNAQNRLKVLRARGLNAQLGFPNASGGGGGGGSPATERGYYVVIPGDRDQLEAIAFRVNQLGSLGAPVRQSLGPRGSHVSVGPWAERSVAERLSQQLRQGGLGDARVYFGRL